MMKISKVVASVLGLAAFASVSNAALVINEVYPGGGSSSGTAAFTRDYVELYNTSALPVSLAGYQLQYAAAGAASSYGTATPLFAFFTGSLIGANDYLTIGTGTAGTGGATLSNTQITNFATGNGGASISASNGAVRLIDASGNTIDTVGFGTVATGPDGFAKSEGTAATAPTTIAFSIGRTSFLDTNSNSADFTQQTPSPTAGTASVAIPAPTPEPTSLALIGLTGMALTSRRRRTA